MTTPALRFAFLLLLVFTTGIAFAQGSPSATPQVPGTTVPSWVFYWVLGLSSAVGGALLLVIKILWDRGNRVSALSDTERGQLQQIYDLAAQKDADQIPLWYVPRKWFDQVSSLQTAQDEVRTILAEMSRQNAELIADLREQLRESRGQQAQQQTKMLKLAVRVQRCVEALAGLQTPEIEDVLGDEEDRSTA